MAEKATEGHQTHEIVCYVSVKERMEGLNSWNTDGGIPVKMRTPLSNTLTRLSNSPAISFTATHCNGSHLIPIANVSLTVGGEDAGTLGKPNIEKIIEKSKPSPFGKGEKTVMDLEYRNGREVVAADIVIGATQPHARGQLYKLIETHISESLFVDKPVKIELYKLAVYGKEGHFDWHRDTTHSDDHHATVLVALNTDWQGGSLGLKHDGKTAEVDLNVVTLMCADEESDEEGDQDSDSEPDEKGDDQSKEDENEGGDGGKSKKSTPTLGFQIIAFYTDIEHKVENITDGTRIVLQFDVNVTGEDDRLDEDEDDDEYVDGGLLSAFSKSVSDTMKPLFPDLGPDTSRDAVLEELVALVKDKHTSGSVDEVVFPLRHLYRLASIKPEYLKGVDAYLYERLKKTFEISLKPIVLIHETDYEGNWKRGNILGYSFASEHEETTERPAKKKKVERNSEIHVPARYDLMVIGSQEYIEHTGNEAQFGEGRYFGGGMFVAPQAT